jgi:hypothetical protein
MSVLAVLTIGVQTKPPLVDDSHLMTEAELPLSVNEPDAAPVQKVVTAGETVPPVGVVVIVATTAVRVPDRHPVVVFLACA